MIRIARWSIEIELEKKKGWPINRSCSSGVIMSSSEKGLIPSLCRTCRRTCSLRQSDPSYEKIGDIWVIRSYKVSGALD